MAQRTPIYPWGPQPPQPNPLTAIVDSQRLQIESLVAQLDARKSPGFLALRVENERLKKALRKIARMTAEQVHDAPWAVPPIARKALASSPTTTKTRSHDEGVQGA